MHSAVTVTSESSAGAYAGCERELQREHRQWSGIIPVFGRRVGEPSAQGGIGLHCGREHRVVVERGRPVLDHEHPTGPQAREQRVERGTRLGEKVGGVVDHQVERGVTELVGDDPAQRCDVGLIDLVVRAHMVVQPVLVDERIERSRPIGLDVERDEAFGPCEECEQHRAAAAMDAELDDMGRAELGRKPLVALDRVSRFGDDDGIRRWCHRVEHRK